VQDAGASAVTIHGRTAQQSYSGQADWDLVAKVASELTIPVLGSGDCVDPEQIIRRMATGVSGVLVGRGVLRNPWVLAQAAEIAAGRPPRQVTLEERGRFLLDYIGLLQSERVNEAQGFRHVPPAAGRDPAAFAPPPPARGRERWIINKIRALGGWYSKGFERGTHFRVAVNKAENIGQLNSIIDEFFFASAGTSTALEPALESHV
jgi:tRNA-dihydrouridine synthase